MRYTILLGMFLVCMGIGIQAGLVAGDNLWLYVGSVECGLYRGK